MAYTGFLKLNLPEEEGFAANPDRRPGEFAAARNMGFSVLDDRMQELLIEIGRK